MAVSKFTKSYKTLLILAGIFICQFIVTYSLNKDMFPGDNQFERVSLLGLYLQIASVTILMPVAEEIAFRYFIGTKKMASIILSAIFYLLITALNFIDHIGTLFIFSAAGLAIIFLETMCKVNTRTTIVQILLISLCFGIFHVFTFFEFNSFSLSYLLYFTGTGIIFCLVRIFLGFKYAIGLHILMNTTLMSVSILTINKDEVIYNCNDYEISVKNSSIFSRNDNNIGFNDDSFFIQNGEIVQSIGLYFYKSNEISNYYQVNPLTNYDISIRPLNNQNFDINSVILCLEYIELIKQKESKK